MAVARDLAVNASLPWPTKISAHRVSLAVVSGSHTSTCPTSVAWWYWLRRTSSVVAMATPMEPPMLRIRLNAAGDDERDQVADASRGQHGARAPRVVAEELLRVEGQQQHARVEAEHRGGDEGGADGEVAVGEHREVHDRIGRGQLAPHERDERERRQRRQEDDELRVEPVLALAPVERELQRAEADDHEHESRH